MLSEWPQSILSFHSPLSVHSPPFTARLYSAKQRIIRKYHTRYLFVLLAHFLVGGVVLLGTPSKALDDGAYGPEMRLFVGVLHCVFSCFAPTTTYLSVCLASAASSSVSLSLAGVCFQAETFCQNVRWKLFHADRLLYIRIYLSRECIIFCSGNIIEVHS